MESSNGSAHSLKGDLVFVADAHLRPGHAEVGRFVNFLANIRASASVLFIVGDLFDTWFGSPDLQKEHHKEIVTALRGLARSGIRIHFVEGNREFRIAQEFLGDPFYRVASDHLVEEYGGRRFFVAHGDMVNLKDWPYRVWRRFAKNPVTHFVLHQFPVPARNRFIDFLERSLKNTNHRNRKRFPMKHCSEFADRAFRRGIDVIILGHFHEERVIRYSRDGQEKMLCVLPAWCDGGGYLRFRGMSEGEFIWADGRSSPSRDISPGGEWSEDPAGRSRSGGRHTPQPAELP